MKTPSFILLFLIAFFLSSCFNIEEEIWIEADGSGQSEYTIDLSEMYSFLMDQSSAELDKIGEENNADSTETMKGELARLLQKGELDTILNFADLREEERPSFENLLDSLKEHTNKENLNEEEEKFIRDLLENMQTLQFRVQISKTDKVIRLSAIQHFRNIEDRLSVGNLINRLKEVSGSERRLLNPDSVSKYSELVVLAEELSNSAGFATINKRVFRYQKTGMDWSALSSEREELSLMKMFLQNGFYRMKVHFPGKVKKIISGDGVEKIDKTTIQIQRPLEDLFDPNKRIDLEVKFKGLK